MILLVATAFAESLEAAFPPPQGATRAPADAFGAWLRALPLTPPGTPVTSYAGEVLAMPAARVVDLPLVPGDLQQCADSLLRLRATWLRATGVSPAFHYTSGFVSRWADWSGGARPRVKGNSVSLQKGAATPDSSDAAFAAWMKDLFMYAGTRSLPLDTEPDVRPDPGDILVAPGSPGHAVILLDVATRGAETWVLAGQGYMPAMSFHVVNGPEAGWYKVEGELLPTAPIALPWADLRKWR